MTIAGVPPQNRPTHQNSMSSDPSATSPLIRLNNPALIAAFLLREWGSSSTHIADRSRPRREAQSVRCKSLPVGCTAGGCRPNLPRCDRRSAKACRHSSSVHRVVATTAWRRCVVASRGDIRRRLTPLNTNRRKHHETTSDCIGGRRHFGDGHHGHSDFCACLLARLGLGTWGAGARTDNSSARATGVCLLSRLFLRLRLSGVQLCQLRLRLSGVFLWRVRRLL